MVFFFFFILLSLSTFYPPTANILAQVALFILVRFYPSPIIIMWTRTFFLKFQLPLLNRSTRCGESGLRERNTDSSTRIRLD